MIGNNLDYNGKSNTANDIIHFIHNFHSKYNIQLMQKCFYRWENYFLNDEIEEDIELNENENTECHNFEKERENLTN